jgi:hypothetical protein
VTGPAGGGEVRAVSLSDLSPKVRRRALALASLRVLLTWVVVTGAYFVLPLGHESTRQVVVRLVLDVGIMVAFIWWQSTRILHAAYPELRAIEALGSIVILFLVLFAALYLAMSNGDASTFSEPLNHTRALYFTTTVFASVGFGDITAETNGSQALVSAQMILDLVIFGAVVRLLVTAVRTGLHRSGRTIQEP